MLVGVPIEIKADERRVALIPSSVVELVRHGHEVVVEAGAGVGIGAHDEEYEIAGARLVRTPEEVFEADLVVKVKEPLAPERLLLRRGQALFTYLHLAADPEQTKDLVESGATCIAYETVTDAHGRLPLLAPMSQVAGRLAIQAGARCLETPAGGSGILLGGVPGVASAKVVVIGGGHVGVNAIQMALGLRADVTVLDRDLDVLERLASSFGPALQTLYSTHQSIEDAVVDADLVIGAVLVPGASAPNLVTEDMVRRMRPGSVVVDVAIDQGGCIETSRPTTHHDPTYVEHGVVHYCVANMPGAVPRTSSEALNNATLPHVLALADLGPVDAMRRDPHLRNGLNVMDGHVTEPHVAAEQGYELTDGLALLDAAGDGTGTA